MMFQCSEKLSISARVTLVPRRACVSFPAAASARSDCSRGPYTGERSRNSTSDQSCDRQLRELKVYSNRRGFELAGEYVDTGWSRAKAGRPELDRLMRDARLRRFDVVLVWKLDRWGRSVALAFAASRSWFSLGIRFVSATQNIDTDESNPTSQSIYTSSRPSRN